MKRTILYAYIALMLAVGLPFLANLGNRTAPREPNPTPPQAVDEASPPITAVRRGEDEPRDEPLITAEHAPETLRLLLPDGSVGSMELQDYLCGVVAAEMPASFHDEALRAQAVAARSYALYCASFSKHGEAQICTDPGCCQAWQSEEQRRSKWGEQFDANEEKISSAVAATRGEYLAFGGQPAFAAFHSSSAGATENSADVWNAVPYLVSVPSPETAEDVPNYISRVTCSPIDFRDTVLSAHPEADFSGAQETWIGELRRDASGRVSTVELGGAALGGKELRQLFSLRSTAFSLTYDGTVFVFTVTGFGHGVGMSQYGADKMARQGANYREILTHYYPGAVLVK